MKQVIFTHSIPEKVDLELLQLESSQLHPSIKVFYSGELLWVGGKKDGFRDPAKVIFEAPNEITDSDLLMVLSNHIAEHHRPDPDYEKAKIAEEERKREMLHEVTEQLRDLDLQIQNLKK